jgi:hypothetical protein
VAVLLSEGGNNVKKSKYLQVLAASVASGLSVRDASEIAGCTESTAYSVSCSDEFRDEVRRLKTEAVERAVSILSHNATRASESLVKLLDSQDEKVVLSAASKLLDRVGPMQELHELRSRIDAIEKQGHGLRVAR